MGTDTAVELDVGGRSVRITHPGRVYFPARGETKLVLLDRVVRDERDT